MTLDPCAVASDDRIPDDTETRGALYEMLGFGYFQALDVSIGQLALTCR
jgi:hypothetical protein